MSSIALFKEITTEESLQQIEKESEKYIGLIVDMNKDAERKKVKESASVIGEIIKKVDRARIDKSKDFKSKVEAEAALITSRLEAANEPLTRLIDAHKEERQRILDAEKARKAQIESVFNKMNDSAMEAIGQTSSVIESIIDDMSDYNFDPEVFQERTDEAAKKFTDLMSKLEQMLAAQVAAEELEARRVEVERKEREQQLAEQAAEQAKRDEEIRAQAAKDAEARHKAELEAAEARRIEEAAQAEQRAKEKAQRAEQYAKAQAEAAAQAERDRIAQAKAAEEAETAKREANKRHRTKINNAIKTAILTTGITEQQAEAIICLVVQGKVENMKVSY